MSQRHRERFNPAERRSFVRAVQALVQVCYGIQALDRPFFTAAQLLKDAAALGLDLTLSDDTLVKLFRGENTEPDHTPDGKHQQRRFVVDEFPCA